MHAVIEPGGHPPGSLAAAVKIDAVRQKADVLQPLFEKTVHVLFVLKNQFSQVGINFFMMGGTELLQDDTGDQEHGGQRDDHDQQHHVSGE
jgi:hypothetical protein